MSRPSAGYRPADRGGRVDPAVLRDLLALAAGNDVRVRHEVPAADREPSARQLVAACGGRDLDSACHGALDDDRRLLGRRRGDGRCGEWLEADEDLRQAGGVEQATEVRRDIRRRRQDQVQLPDGPRAPGQPVHRGNRAGRQDATGEPDDEETLSRSQDRPGHAIRIAQHAATQPVVDGSARRGTERLADADREDEAAEDDQGAQGRLHLLDGRLDDWQGQEGDAAACHRAQQAAQLRKEPRPRAEQRGDDDDRQGGDIEYVRPWGRAGARVHPCSIDYRVCGRCLSRARELRSGRHRDQADAPTSVSTRGGCSASQAAMASSWLSR